MLTRQTQTGNIQYHYNDIVYIVINTLYFFVYKFLCFCRYVLWIYDLYSALYVYKGVRLHRINDISMFEMLYKLMKCSSFVTFTTNMLMCFISLLYNHG